MRDSKFQVQIACYEALLGGLRHRMTVRAFGPTYQEWVQNQHKRVMYRDESSVD